MSIIWQFFEVLADDETKAKCLLCLKTYSRGSDKAKNRTTSNSKLKEGEGETQSGDEDSLCENDESEL